MLLSPRLELSSLPAAIIAWSAEEISFNADGPGELALLLYRPCAFDKSFYAISNCYSTLGAYSAISSNWSLA